MDKESYCRNTGTSVYGFEIKSPSWESSALNLASDFKVGGSTAKHHALQPHGR